MRIGCLGWGSLVWDPRDLPLRGVWFLDGPLIPIEFSHQSQDGRITLVIDPRAKHVRALWVILSVDDLDAAISSLARREGISNNLEARIGRWTGFDDGDVVTRAIGTWAQQAGLDAVVWTALSPSFDGNSKRPSKTKLLKYLSDLPPEKRSRAETYIRKAPRQIDTDYRRAIELRLGWTPY
ncbi:MAG: hypothetical protein ABI596_03490 [Pyrinomonadaceae bacterium]